MELLTKETVTGKSDKDQNIYYDTICRNYLWNLNSRTNITIL